MIRFVHLLVFCLAVAAAHAAQPSFVAASLAPAGTSGVVKVVEREAADLILLDGGAEAGFREGMLAHVFRGERHIATVLLAAVARDRAVALITDLVPDAAISPGDLVRVQTFQLNS